MLGRVVSPYRFLLVAVQGLHGRIHIHYPGLGQQFVVTAVQMCLEPTRVILFFPFQKRSSHGIFAAHSLHPQHLRQNAVAADRGHMRVALVTRQYAQKDGSQDVLLGRRVPTPVAQWTFLHPLLPQTAYL